MKRIFFSSHYIAVIICLLLATSCEVDNYDGPNASVQGAILDQNNQPFHIDQNSEYIRMREVSWAAGDENIFTANRTIPVMQDGTYNHTRQFAGDYLMFPTNGNFFPFYEADDEIRDTEEAGVLVKISGVTTQNFNVTPYLTIEWVVEPRVVDNNYIECVVRFTRNQKPGFNMPALRFGNMRISRTKYPSRANLSEFAPPQLTVTNDMEGQDITFRTQIPVKWTGIDYYIQVVMNCQAVSGDASTNYPGLSATGAWNGTTIKSVYVP